MDWNKITRTFARRRQRIIDDFQSGKTVAELATKHKVTRQRVYAILASAKDKSK